MNDKKILRLVNYIRESLANELQMRPVANCKYNIVVRDLTFDFLASEGNLDELQRYQYDPEHIEVILDTIEAFVWQLTTIGYTHFTLVIRLEKGRITSKSYTSTTKFNQYNKMRASQV